MKECSCCGELIDDDASVCPYCGEQQFDSYAPIEVSTLERSVSCINNTCGMVSGIVSDASQVMQSVAEMNYQISVLDHQLEAFKAQVGADVEKYKIAAQVLAPQLENASRRIDRIVDKILSMDEATCDANQLKRQTQLLEMLQGVSSSFNSILLRLV